jgi:hypothetical protein
MVANNATPLALLVALLAGCGGFPPPNDRLAATVAAARSARELGAPNSPQAALHLKLADEELASAKGLMTDGKNERASYVLLRAKADAELALALAKQNSAKAETQQVQEQIKTLQGGNP